MPRLYTPVASPSVTLPLLELVMLVLTWSGVVREAPFKSILPVAVMAEGKKFSPTPCKVRLLIAVDCPTVPPNVIRAEPLLMVRSRAPLMVVVEPLNIIAASVDASAIAPVERVIGPV